MDEWEREDMKAMEAELTALRRDVKEWFAGRAGDFIPNESYQRLRVELAALLEPRGQSSD